MVTHDVEGERDPLGPRTHAPENADAGTRARDGSPPTGFGPAAVQQLQRSAGNAAVASLLGGQEDQESPVKDVIRSAGAPLDLGTRSLMESRLGHDFSDVRVHTDSAAGSSAKSVQAQAYTVDNHIVFGEGRYNPGSPDTTRTLAHELTHVIQQRSGPVDGTPAPGGIKVSDPADRFEQEAERSADRVLSEAAPLQREAEGPEMEEEELQALSLQRQEGVDESEDESEE